MNREQMTENEASIYVYAARYAHDRNTAAAYQVVKEILHVWDSLPERIQNQLKREAKKATYNRNDWQRLIDR